MGFIPTAEAASGLTVMPAKPLGSLVPAGTATGTVTVNGAAVIGSTLNIQDGTVSFANAGNLGSAAVRLGDAAGPTTGTFEYRGLTPAAARGGAFALNGTGVVRVTEP